MSRLLLVSNRLPVTVKRNGDAFEVTRSAGGLATGLSGPHQKGGGLWLGWPGPVGELEGSAKQKLEAELSALRTVPLYLSDEEVSRYYEGFSNGVLWPLFHYSLDRIPNDAADWDAYRSVNEKFAALVAEHYQPGDRIWVHDYQLALVPGMLRERLPDARIGYFLHIPFPAAEVFRSLPWREEILRGLLGADLIGFHALSYTRAFANALLQTIGVPSDVDRVDYEGRVIRIGAFPMGIDVPSFAEGGERSEVVEQVEALRSSGQRILLGVDRLDYTKGIPRRLLAVERLLEKNPGLRGKIRFIQVAVPSRENVVAYEQLRREVDELVGRINGEFGTLSWAPVHYLYRAIPTRQLIGLYRAADVMLVTPLRDGMNLVAKEFVAARTDGDGVLVLSEFAGAASELGEALTVNPYDVEQLADETLRALTMPEDERRLRMKSLRARVEQHDVHAWAESFVTALDTHEPGKPGAKKLTRPEDLDRLVKQVISAPQRVLLLDYDGTLRGFTGLSELAVPDPALLDLLNRLARTRNTRVHLVSGRKRELMEQWFSKLPVALHAEHGLWRGGLGQPWTALREVDTSWKPQVREVMRQFVDRVPGALIEEKTATLVFHYRMADPEFAALQANELQLHLSQRFSNIPIEVLPGDKVVEVRPYGVNKGVVVEQILASDERTGQLLAMGDDRTDEDMFRAVPEEGFTVHVGPKPSIARYRIKDVTAARALLQRLL